MKLAASLSRVPAGTVQTVAGPEPRIGHACRTGSVLPVPSSVTYLRTRTGQARFRDKGTERPVRSTVNVTVSVAVAGTLIIRHPHVTHMGHVCIAGVQRSAVRPTQ